MSITLKILDEARETDADKERRMKKVINRAFKLKPPDSQNMGPSGDYISRDNSDQVNEPQ